MLKKKMGRKFDFSLVQRVQFSYPDRTKETLLDVLNSPKPNPNELASTDPSTLKFLPNFFFHKGAISQKILKT